MERAQKRKRALQRVNLKNLNLARMTVCKLCYRYKITYLEDIHSIAAEALIDAARRYNPKKGASFETWLASHARWKLFNHLGTLDLKLDVVHPEFWDSLELSADGLERRIIAKDFLYKLASKLTPGQRRRFFKFYFEDKDQREIAKEEQVSPQMISLDLLAARKKAVQLRNRGRLAARFRHGEK